MIPAWPALVVIALLFGAIGGWVVRLHTAHDRYLVGLAERYQSERAWLEAQTAAAIAELERDATKVKEELKSRRTARVERRTTK